MKRRIHLIDHSMSGSGILFSIFSRWWVNINKVLFDMADLGLSAEIKVRLNKDIIYPYLHRVILETSEREKIYSKTPFSY